MKRSLLIMVIVMLLLSPFHPSSSSVRESVSYGSFHSPSDPDRFTSLRGEMGKGTAERRE